MNIQKLRKYLLLFCITGAALAATAFAFSYPGLVEDSWAELRFASLEDAQADAEFFLYNVRYFQKLEKSPESGLYDLSASADGKNLSEALLSFHRGRFDEAIHGIELEIEATGETEHTLLWLALAHQRRAEQQGCLKALSPVDARHASPFGPHAHRRICALPAAAAMGATEGMEQAAEIFERLLDQYDSENTLYRWLLNFSYMALARFPEGVPERYRISSPFIEAFYGDTSRQVAERFADLKLHDRAAELGVDVFDAGKGVAVEDFDGDGFLDLVTAGSFSRLRFFRNDQGLRFIEQTESSGLAGALQPFMLTAADYDNDGWMDLFVGRPYHTYSLFKNRGDGTFTDVTESSGLVDTLESGQSTFTFTSAWSDIDNDGDLDLFLAQLGRKLPLKGGLLGKRPASSRLFENREGRFVDATEAWALADIVEDRTFTGAAFGDYDNDGREDLFLSSFTRGMSKLLRNTPEGRFEETDLIHNPDPGFMATFVDIDHDGRLDLFQGSNGPASRIVDQAVFSGQSPERYTQKIYLQRNGRFVEHTAPFQGFHVSSMGASFGDLNNDGCHDFYLGTGNSEPTFVLPNLMFLGRTDGASCTVEMDHVSMLHGLGTIQKGHGIVFFDFDNDGDQDVYSSLGGMWPADPWPNQLFVNHSSTDHAWVRIRLTGTTSNRFGVGARIKVVAADRNGREIVRHRRIGHKTGFGSAPLLAHVGLGEAVELKRIEVRWPGATTPVSYNGRLNTSLHLEEEKASDRQSFRR